MWQFLFWVYSAVICISALLSFSFNTNEIHIILLNFGLMAATALPVFGLAYGKKVFQQYFWQVWLVFLICYEVADLLFGVKPGVADVNMLITIAIYLFMDIAVYRYAYMSGRVWGGMKGGAADIPPGPFTGRWM
jgi:hypothetical protein